jgi:dephospho-CoA kinase
MKLQVGITGNMGSGKSTVCQIFAALGIPVYDADSQAKSLMTESPLKEQLTALFGTETYLPDGSLNRTYLSQMVFSDSAKLEQLNALVHPAVAIDAKSWHEKQADVPYTLREAALLIESGSYKQLDSLIVVTAPEEIRVERVITRDHTTAEAALARMHKQLPESKKVALAQFVINNDGSTPLIPQVLKIHFALINGIAKPTF